MIEDFYRLTKHIALHIMPQEALKYDADYPLSMHLDRLDMFLKKSNLGQSFQCSIDLPLGWNMTHHQADFITQTPTTTEDVFRIVWDTAWKVTTGVDIWANKHVTQNNLNTIDLPEMLQAVHNIVTSETSANLLRNSGASQPSCIGINYTAEQIELKYNMPLNNHSSTFQLRYNNNTHECTLAAQFLGQSRDRWEVVDVLMSLSPHLSNLTLKGPVVFERNAGLVAWEWHITKPEDIETAITYLAAAARISFQSSYSFRWMDLSDLLESMNRKATPWKTTLQASLNAYCRLHGRSSASRVLQRFTK